MRKFGVLTCLILFAACSEPKHGDSSPPAGEKPKTETPSAPPPGSFKKKKPASNSGGKENGSDPSKGPTHPPSPGSVGGNPEKSNPEEQNETGGESKPQLKPQPQPASPTFSITQLNAEYLSDQKAKVTWTVSQAFPEDTTYEIFLTKKPEMNPSTDQKVFEGTGLISAEVDIPKGYEFKLEFKDVVYVYVRYHIPQKAERQAMTGQSSLEFVRFLKPVAIGWPEPSPQYKPKVDLNCHPKYPEESKTIEPCDKLATRYTKASPLSNEFYVQRWHVDDAHPVKFHLHESVLQKDPSLGGIDIQVLIKEVVVYLNSVAREQRITTGDLVRIEGKTQENVRGKNDYSTHTISLVHDASTPLFAWVDIFPSPRLVMAGHLYKGEILDADISMNLTHLIQGANHAKIEGLTFQEKFKRIFKSTLLHEILNGLGYEDNYAGEKYSSVMAYYTLTGEDDSRALNYEFNRTKNEDYDIQVLRYLYSDFYHSDKTRFDDLDYDVLRVFQKPSQ